MQIVSKKSTLNLELNKSKFTKIYKIDYQNNNKNKEGQKLNTEEEEHKANILYLKEPIFITSLFKIVPTKIYSSI